MKPIIFARITDMKYYKGITDNDKPVNGGSYVKDTNMAHECYNFDVAQVEDGKEQCLGFTMLMGGNNPQLHIEKIVGCKSLKNSDVANDVIVVFCARPGNGKTTRIVGFYKHATVYRYPQVQDFYAVEGGIYEQEYNFIADKDDCVLLPYNERFDGKWFVPKSGKMGYDFGFGHSNIWYAASDTYNTEEIEYVNRLIDNIENYDGQNLV